MIVIMASIAQLRRYSATRQWTPDRLVRKAIAWVEGASYAAMQEQHSNTNCFDIEIPVLEPEPQDENCILCFQQEQAQAPAWRHIRQIHSKPPKT